MFSKILVICVGNICRSPMGEAVLAHELKKACQESIEVRSAGLDALVGKQAHEVAQRLMHERGIDISGHRAHQLNRDMIGWADLVLVMENAHKFSLESWEPTARGKIYRLGEWGNFDIPDPYLKSDEAFEIALELINKGVSEWTLKLKGRDTR